MLDLIDDGAMPQLREKAPRVGFGEFSLVRRFEVDVLEVGEGRSAERGLSRLPRSGHGHEGVLPKEGLQPLGDFPLDHGNYGSLQENNLKVLSSYCATRRGYALIAPNDEVTIVPAIGGG